MSYQSSQRQSFLFATPVSLVHSNLKSVSGNALLELRL